MPRTLLAGVGLILAGVLLGGGLVAYGFADLVVTDEPVPIARDAEVVAEEVGQTFSVYRTGEASAEECRVTTAGGTAVPLVRAPGTSTMTVGDRTYHQVAVFEAPTPGRLRVDCPPTLSLFVGGADPVGPNVIAIVGGAALGGLLVVAGIVVALIGGLAGSAARAVGIPPPPPPAA